MSRNVRIFIKKKIGELLLEQGLISKNILNEALNFQKKFGGFLGNYLVRHRHVTEKDIVKCLSSQYGFPYLNLSNFKIEAKTTNIIPATIAKKFSLIPIDKHGEVITIATANPLDQEALDAVKLITGCEIQAFITTISEINNALETYYGIEIPEEIISDIKPEKLEFEEFGGQERRKFIRFNANIEIHFAYQDKYRKLKTNDISGSGASFFSPNYLPLNSFLTLEIDLPEEISKRPIATVVKVVRIKEIEHKKRYEVGVMFVQIDPSDRLTIIRHAERSLTK